MGSVYGKVSEKEITVNIAKEIKKLNENQDQYEIILTRDSDAYPTLQERTAMINKLNPEIVISLHMNSNPEKETPKQGTEVYIQNTDHSKKLAEKISKKFDVSKVEERNLHMLRETKAPAVLVELGFMNNTKEREYVTSEKGQKEIAQKFTDIIREY